LAARAGIPTLVLVIAVGVCGQASAATEAAPPPGPVGAYQQPAPETPDDKHAKDFVNDLLKTRGSKSRVTAPDLRGGVVLAPRPDVTADDRDDEPSAPPPTQPRDTPGDVEHEAQLPSPDAGPAERAGVASPVDQDVPGILVGLVIGVVLAAVGVVLEVSDRRQRRV
jgi:hypothetical protein